MLGDPTKTIIQTNIHEWVLYISKGRLLYPCPKLEKIALEIEILFQHEYGDTFSKKTKAIDRITEQVFYSFFN